MRFRLVFICLVSILISAVAVTSEYPRVLGNRVIEYGKYVFIRLANKPTEISHTMADFVKERDDITTDSLQTPLRAVWSKMFVSHQDPETRSTILANVVMAQNPLGKLDVACGPRVLSRDTLFKGHLPMPDLIC